MKMQTVVDLVRTGQLPVLVRLAGLIEPVYRVCFLAAASAHGVLRLLAPGPMRLERIAENMDVAPADYEVLATWLDFGVKLGELQSDSAGYALHGYWAKKLAEPLHDAVAASVEEVARFHYEAVFRVPAMLKARKRFSLADQDGELIARATRVLEPLVHEAVDLVVPTSGTLRLLEVGCGSAAHLRYACTRNNDVVGLGVELQDDVAVVANRNVENWGLADRVRVIAGDVRKADVGDSFDIVTLHNLIYYFPVEERVTLLERLRSHLVPGGKLLITTACREPGGDLGLDAIDLWFTASETGGHLPSAREMAAQLKAAGFVDVQTKKLLPGGSYYAFVSSALQSNEGIR